MAEQIQRSQVVIRRKQVEIHTGLSRSTIYSKTNRKSRYYDPTFPKPIRLGGNSVAWIAQEIDIWVGNRIAQRDNASNEDVMQ